MRIARLNMSNFEGIEEGAYLNSTSVSGRTYMPTSTNYATCGSCLSSLVYVSVIATVHQPSLQIIRVFDCIVILPGRHALYEGPGVFAPAEYVALCPPV
jgi:hypothetical protein